MQKALLGDALPSMGASRALVQAYQQVKKPLSAAHRVVLIITLVSTVLIFLSFVCTGVALDYARGWGGWHGSTTPTRVGLTLRVLRLARVSFYMKLINTPLLQELANIVQGFLVPSLFWVLVTLSVVVYVSALAMRATVVSISGGYSGPDVCGSGDLIELGTTVPDDCGGLHHIYGNETCMVVVIFGMFNIITAIFVEATMNGLKETDAARKYAQAYESNYMTEQLGKLVMAISKYTINVRKDEGIVSRQPVREHLGAHDDTGKIMISFLTACHRSF
eukprot:Skav201344  [mRNA]  locus=scaffold1389:424118:437038:+ [translate_table: standard]